MSWTDIENLESGSSVRNKINAAFNALFGATPVTTLWSIITASGRIKPDDDREVEITTLHASQVNTSALNAGAANQVQVFNNQLRLPYLGGFSSMQKPLVIDSEGFVKTDDTETAGDAVTGKGIYYNTGVAAVDLSLLSPNHMVNAGLNVDITLPSPSNSNNADVYVRKMANNAYSVSLHTDWDELRFNHEIGKGMTTVDPGAWIHLKALNQGDVAWWIVVAQGGTWTLIP